MIDSKGNSGRMLLLYEILFAPIELIVAWIFNFVFVKFPQFGVIGAIVAVSICINFLALPLYNVAESIQKKERDISKALEPRVKRIKKAFKGNEQFMMLSTYYRQNNYNPIYVLRSSLPILLEIPFFIAAYHFLNNCNALSGQSFLFITDLGKPDEILKIGQISFHVLPFVMTLINFISGAIYTKDAPFKERIQLYLVAALFLILLYNAPSGLVIYWILNNLFSLAKNIVLKTKHPGKVLHAIISALLLVFAIYFAIDQKETAMWKRAAVVLFAIAVAILPLLKHLISKLNFKTKNNALTSDIRGTLQLTLFAGLAISLLLGLVLPSSIVASSPTEFSFIGDTDSPLTYILHSFSIYFGMFVVWTMVIYFMFNRKVKNAEGIFLFSVLVIAILNAYVFKSDYGNLTRLLTIETQENLISSKSVFLISVISYIAVIAVTIFISKHKKQILVFIAIIACIAELALGLYNIVSISKTFKMYAESHTPTNNDSPVGISKEYNLSKTNPNVVIIFLDRAVGAFIPQIFEEHPDIEKQFDGFTYYSNTLSFSNVTVEGVPPMLGGYEYTPNKMNARSDELLRNKHNEALLVMPKLFLDAGYSVTLTDPPWTNYFYNGDLSIFKDYPEMKVSEIEGKYFENYFIEKNLVTGKLNKAVQDAFVDFSALQVLPPLFRYSFYLCARRYSEGFKGDDAAFFSQLSNLYYLREMTDFESQKPSFIFLENESTHDVAVALSDDYETIAQNQIEDNTTLHYQANVAALKQIGKYLDYLRDNNCFDNTRVILVSDHGMAANISGLEPRMNQFGPLLMVKDFNSTGLYKTDDSFMTNADTLSLAIDGLDISKVNPMTGKILTSDKNNGVDVYIAQSWNAEKLRNDYTFKHDNNQAWHVSDDIHNPDNWIPLTEWQKEVN